MGWGRAASGERREEGLNIIESEARKCTEEKKKRTHPVHARNKDR